MHQASSGRRRGLTLLEMLLALSGTAVIGAATVMLITGVAYGTDTTRDNRALVVQAKAISTTLNAHLRESQQGLAHQTGDLVLWVRDANGNDLPDNTELRRITFNSGTGALTLHEPDPALVEASYALTDNFFTVTDALIGSNDLVPRTLASELDGFTLAFDSGSVTTARLITYTLTLTAGGETESVVHAVRLRNGS